MKRVSKTLAAFGWFILVALISYLKTCIYVIQ